MVGEDRKHRHTTARSVKSQELKRKRGSQETNPPDRETLDRSKHKHVLRDQLEPQEQAQVKHSRPDEQPIPPPKTVSHDETRRPRRGMKGIAALRPSVDPNSTTVNRTAKIYDYESDNSSAMSSDYDDDEGVEDDAVPSHTRSSPPTHHTDSRSRLELVRNQGRPPSSMQYLTRRVQAFDKAESSKDDVQS